MSRRPAPTVEDGSSERRSRPNGRKRRRNASFGMMNAGRWAMSGALSRPTQRRRARACRSHAAGALRRLVLAALGVRPVAAAMARVLRVDPGSKAAVLCAAAASSPASRASISPLPEAIGLVARKAAAGKRDRSTLGPPCRERIPSFEILLVVGNPHAPGVAACLGAATDCCTATAFRRQCWPRVDIQFIETQYHPRQARPSECRRGTADGCRPRRAASPLA